MTVITLYVLSWSAYIVLTTARFKYDINRSERQNSSLLFDKLVSNETVYLDFRDLKMQPSKNFMEKSFGNVIRFAGKKTVKNKISRIYASSEIKKYIFSYIDNYQIETKTNSTFTI